MAQQNRVTIQGLINLYITSNGNKEITGAQLKEILTNLNDSAFLQLDELRTALSTSYNPANPSDWNVLPTEVKAALDEAISRVEGLENAGFQTAIQTPYTRTVPSDWDGTPNELQSSTDELASRLRVFETNNFSQDIAFVSNDGHDLTFELGNIGKPFATIQAAITAVPVNGIVKVLGGSYSEDININKEGVYLDISNCQITGSFNIVQSNIYIKAINSTIINGKTGAVANNVLLGNSGGAIDNLTIEGGTWDGLDARTVDFTPALSLVKLIDCVFNCNSTTLSLAEFETFVILQNCIFNNNSTAICMFASGGKQEFTNCQINSPLALGIICINATLIFENTNIISTLCMAVSTSGPNFYLVANNCEFRSTTSESFRIGYSANNIKVTNCTLVGATDCIVFDNTNRVAGTTNILQDNLYYAGSGGDIFDGALAGGDAGTTEVLGGTFNKVFAGFATVNVSATTLTVVGLQDVPE